MSENQCLCQQVVAAVRRHFPEAAVTDVRAAPPLDVQDGRERPGAPAPADERAISYAEAASYMRAEAWRIHDTQEKLVAHGLRSAPDPRELRRARGFEQGVTILTLCGEDATIKARLRELASAVKGGAG